jgi:hypothetical protein
LPTKVIGEDKRLNGKGSFVLPERFAEKNHPEYLVGKNIRLLHLCQNYEQYLDKMVTVSGWAQNTKLQAKDTLLFVSLVDGSNANPLQVVIENSVPNW